MSYIVSSVAIKMITNIDLNQNQSKTPATSKMKIFLAIDNNWNPLTNVKKTSFLDVWDHTSATVDIWWRAKRLCILVYSCMFYSDLLLFYMIAFFLRYWHCTGRMIGQFIVGREFLTPPRLFSKYPFFISCFIFYLILSTPSQSLSPFSNFIHLSHFLHLFPLLIDHEFLVLTGTASISESNERGTAKGS